MKQKTVLILVIILILCLCCGLGASGAIFYAASSDNDNSDNNDGADNDTDTATDEPLVQEYSQGETVTVGSIEWKIEEASIVGEVLAGKDSRFATEYYTPKDLKAAGKFIRVKFTVKNNGDRAVTYANSHIKLVDQDDKQYDISNNAFSWVPDKENLYLDSINPGNMVTATAFFDVSTDVTEYKFLVSDLQYFDKKTALIKLDI